MKEGDWDKRDGRKRRKEEEKGKKRKAKED